jgi:hypothetical protein
VDNVKVIVQIPAAWYDIYAKKMTKLMTKAISFLIIFFIWDIVLM